jgi:hypothetical protein
MAALAGTYAVRFSGFDRQTQHSRHLIGVGRLQLVGNGTGTLTGHQWSTNSQMWGQPGIRLRHSEYALSGSYALIENGPPLVAALDVTFTPQRGDDTASLKDRFVILQSGPDRFWVVSSNARDLRGERIDELVVGEAVKVDPDTW